MTKLRNEPARRFTTPQNPSYPRVLRAGAGLLLLVGACGGKIEEPNATNGANGTAGAVAQDDSVSPTDHGGPEAVMGGGAPGPYDQYAQTGGSPLYDPEPGPATGGVAGWSEALAAGAGAPPFAGSGAGGSPDVMPPDDPPVIDEPPILAGAAPMPYEEEYPDDPEVTANLGGAGGDTADGVGGDTVVGAGGATTAGVGEDTATGAGGDTAESVGGDAAADIGDNAGAGADE